MQNRTIIISNSLTNDFLSPKEKFLKVDVNVGLREINRLMGEGEQYSQGPLPVYLHEALTAMQEGRQIMHILVRDLHNPEDPLQQPELLRFGSHNILGTEGAEFVAPIQSIVPHSTVIDSNTLALPIYTFHAAMRTFLGKDILTLTAEERESLYFVVTGVYSNIRVLNIASKIRNEYQFPSVFVSPHLVGSKYPDAHLAALQIDFPNALVQVVPDLREVYELTGISKEVLNAHLFDRCRIVPREVAAVLEDEPRKIIETIFMFHTTVRLKSLTGGYSGGLLFIAEGKKQDSITDPEILKIDTHIKMQQEIQGYNAIIDYLGKNVPTFGHPVSYGKYTGIKMELASRYGAPATLQSIFESVKTSHEMEAFCEIFGSILTLLGEKLYENTKRQKKIYPYKEFGLHSEQQRIWLRENITYILPETDL
ncbi:hypothetical protein ACFL9U_13590, partial [Thermodesulfobacteriota bacterium]